MGLVVLVVDDNADSRELVGELLEANGYAVHSARDGVDALDKLDAGLRPDLIILDLMMPRMNGWAFREAMLARPNVVDVPVLVVTAAPQVSPPTRVDAVLAKPLDIDVLLDHVKMLTASRAARARGE